MSVYCMHERRSDVRSIVIFRTGMAEKTARVALPLQLDKYTWIPTFWHSVHICNTEKKTQPTESRRRVAHGIARNAVNFTLNSKVYSMMVSVSNTDLREEPCSSDIDKDHTAAVD